MSDQKAAMYLTIPADMLHSYTQTVLGHMLEVTVPTGYRIMLGTNSDVYLGPIRSFLDAPYDAYAWLHGFYGIGNRFEWRLAGPAVMEKPEGFLWAAVWPDLQSLVDDLVQTWEDTDE